MSKLFSPPVPDEPVVFALAEPGLREQALALLLTGRPRKSDPAVAEFLSFTHSQNLSVDQLWTATRAGRLLGSTLIVPSAGRAGMIFVWPLGNKANLHWTGQLIRQALQAQDSAGLRLVQALLDPSQRLEQQALLDAGFHELAVLVYMHRLADGPAAPAPPKIDLPGVQVLRWSEQNRGLFAGAILDSYHDTLDCPRLLGLRQIDDILAGHMATGRFTPELWHVLVHAGKPVGVMLVNHVPQRQALELVYLGLSKGWRKRGLGRALVRAALGWPPLYHATSLVLAVDQKNQPAVALYRALGFVSTTRKLALIHALT